MPKRIQFVVDDKIYEALKEFKNETGATSLADVFRNALKIYEWVICEQRKGREIVSRPTNKTNKKRKRVLSRFSNIADT